MAKTLRTDSPSSHGEDESEIDFFFEFASSDCATRPKLQMNSASSALPHFSRGANSIGATTVSRTRFAGPGQRRLATSDSKSTGVHAPSLNSSRAIRTSPSGSNSRW